MSVKIVSETQSFVQDIQTPEELIVYCARVSNPSNQHNKETAPRLLRYLIEHEHWSPFELASLCVEIKTSRAIAAQILRHRSFTFQEFSQRYSTATQLEPLELRRQGKTNRQVGDETFTIQEDPKLFAKIDKLQEEAINTYNEMLQLGIARESARMILPLNTQTTLYMSGTIRSWIHYINLRTKQDTQKEHRDIAVSIKNLFKQKYPKISEALKW